MTKHVFVPKPVALLAMLAVAAAGGCQHQSRQSAEAKREQDRAAIRLSEAEKQRDEYRNQVTSLRENLNAAEQRAQQARAELEAGNARLRQATSDLEKARAGQANADQAAQQLALMQNKLKENADRQAETDRTIAALRQQLDEAQKQANVLLQHNEKLVSDTAALRGAGGNGAAPTTMPTMNK